MILRNLFKRNTIEISASTSEAGIRPALEEDTARQYLEYSRLLSRVLWRSFFAASLLGILSAYLRVLPLLFESNSPTIRFGAFDGEIYLATLGVISVLAIGLQVAVRSPATDDPLEQGRREWLGRFSLLLTVAGTSATLYLFIQVIVMTQREQILSGEHLAAIFLVFGISCISADASVVVERTASKPEVRVTWDKLALEKVNKAIVAVTELVPQANRLNLAARRFFLWNVSPLSAVILGRFVGVADTGALLLLAVVALSLSLGW